MAKLTLEQRRLETLRRQLQGKSAAQFHKSEGPKTQTNIYSRVPVSIQPQIQTLEADQFLKRDLLKVFVLAAAMVGVEIIFALNPAIMHWFLRS